MNYSGKDFWERNSYVNNSARNNNYEDAINKGANKANDMQQRLNEISQSSNGVIKTAGQARNNIIGNSASSSSYINYYGSSSQTDNKPPTVNSKNNTNSNLNKRDYLSSMQTLRQNKF